MTGKRPESIGDIFDMNRQIREGLLAVISPVSEDAAARLPDGETWSIAGIVEHISIVDQGTAWICSKLLKKAQEDGTRSTGVLAVTDTFRQKTLEMSGTRLEAPERVQPTGQVPLEDSIKKMAATAAVFDEVREGLESFELASHTFPHPYFGELTAPEWLLIAGGHELRHTKQIQERLIQA